MVIENSNSVVHVLVLARPADSMCAILASAFRQWRYAFSTCSTIYEVVNGVKDIPVGQPLILIVRPAMLGPQAALFMERHFPDLRIVGWIDSGENVSDCAIAQTTVNGMVTASHLDQLQRMIRTFCKTVPRNRSVSDMASADFPDKSGRPEYELSDNEVNALLGVE